jgi:hypothetical protein
MTYLKKNISTRLGGGGGGHNTEIVLSLYLLTQEAFTTVFFNALHFYHVSESHYLQYALYPTPHTSILKTQAAIITVLGT